MSDYECKKETIDRVERFKELDTTAKSDYAAFTDRHNEEIQILETNLERRNDALTEAKRALRQEAEGVGAKGPRRIVLPPFTVQRKASVSYKDGILDILREAKLFDAAKAAGAIVIPPTPAPSVDAEKMTEFVMGTKNTSLIAAAAALLDSKDLTPAVTGPKEMILFGEKEAKK